jgi:hypothetical protein
VVNTTAGGSRLVDLTAGRWATPAYQVRGKGADPSGPLHGGSRYREGAPALRLGLRASGYSLIALRYKRFMVDTAAPAQQELEVTGWCPVVQPPECTLFLESDESDGPRLYDPRKWDVSDEEKPCLSNFPYLTHDGSSSQRRMMAEVLASQASAQISHN